MTKTFALIAAVGIAASANATDTLALWTFETSVPTTAGPHAAEVGAGNALGFHALAGTVYSNPAGNGSVESFSSNFWSTGDYYQFSITTVGYENIQFGWSQTRSSTGPDNFNLEWSTDGVNFATLQNYTVGTLGWSTSPANFQAGSVFAPIALPAGAADQASLIIRLTSTVTPTNTAGTNRVDDIFFTGTLIPSPASAALLGLGGMVAARRRRG